MSEIKFKDVPVGAEFGFKDYFFSKVSEEYGEFSGDVHRFDPETNVWMEEPVVTDDDWNLGPVCSVEHEECEACQ